MNDESYYSAGLGVPNCEICRHIWCGNSAFILPTSDFRQSVAILPGGCKNSHPVGFLMARTWLSKCFRFVGNLFEAGLPWLSATGQDDRISQSSGWPRGIPARTDCQHGGLPSRSLFCEC